MQFVKNDGGRSKYYPSTLKKDQAGDCIIRAISIASNEDYMKVWNDLFKLGTEIGQLPNAWKTLSIYLSNNGWVEHKPFRDSKNRKMKIKNIPFDKSERYLMRTTSHLTAIVNGELHDSWNCMEWCGNTYYTKSKNK